MWLPESVPGETVFEAFTMVRLEPVRSAEPPTSSGSAGTRASSTFCDALRVAMVSAFGVVSASSAWTVPVEIGRQLALHPALELGGVLREARPVGLEQLLPAALERACPPRWASQPS